MISPSPPDFSTPSRPSSTVSTKVTDRLGAPPASGEDDLGTRTVTTTRVVSSGDPAAVDDTAGVAPTTPADDLPADEQPGGAAEDGPIPLPRDDEVPAEDEAAAAEETGIAAVEPADGAASAAAPADGASATAPAGVREVAPAGAGTTGTATGSQRAVLYEEGSSQQDEGNVLPGSVSWEIVNQSFGGQDPEPVVRAGVDIPGRNLRANLLIRANRDASLPASHLIEVSFLSADGAVSDAVANVPGLIMKENEEDSGGDVLRGAAARVSTGLFWIALSANPEDEQTNRRLLSERTWIDVPILYENGRRAILSLQKGGPGERAVTQAFEAWGKG
jgi:hypothetical protein